MKTDMDRVLHQVMATYVAISPEPPEVVGSDVHASPRSRRWSAGWAFAAGFVVVLAVGVVMAVLSLGGSEESGVDRPGVDSVPVSLAGFRVYGSSTNAGLDAIVTGIVEIDVESGCVWLSDPSGVRFPVVWPTGAVAESDPIGIRLVDGQLVQSGDRVEGGGGWVPAGMTTSDLGLEPFPRTCIQVGDAAVFNSNSAITVTKGVGLELAETLVRRFSSPESIGFELIAVNANARSVAVADFVTGTVHRYDPGQYEAPTDAIDGASGGGGFTHVWANGTIHTYWPLDAEPLVYQPNPLRQVPGVASTLRVVPAPDGDQTWLVQPGFDSHPTLVELVNVVGLQLDRMMAAEIEGSWQPVGATIEGLIVVGDDPEPVTRLVSADGTVAAELSGTALSVGWNGAAINRPDGSLVVTDAGLGNPVSVDKPGEGQWASVGGPVVPSTSPPIRTGADLYLVMLANEPNKGALSAGELVVVDPGGAARTIYQLSQGPHVASWSRDGDWVVVVEGSSVTLISLDDGSVTPLGELIPDSYFVLTAG